VRPPVEIKIADEPEEPFLLRSVYKVLAAENIFQRLPYLVRL
jgi:hypothetical protein